MIFFSLEGRPVSGVVRKFKCLLKKRSLSAMHWGFKLDRQMVKRCYEQKQNVRTVKRWIDMMKSVRSTNRLLKFVLQIHLKHPVPTNFTKIPLKCVLSKRE